MPPSWGVFFVRAKTIIVSYDNSHMKKYIMSILQQEKTTRYTLIVRESTRAKIIEVTKRHNISQAELIRALLDNMDEEALAPKFKEIRSTKVEGRKAKRDGAKVLLSKLSALSPEQLKMIEDMSAAKLAQKAVKG